jgi:Protein of unknown function (DUF1203)
MTFQVHALPYEPFAPLFEMPEGDLPKAGAARVVVNAKPGFPCRVSLADAEPGETVVLVNFEHQPENTPYRASHAIFVRENAKQVYPEVGEVPEVLTSRLISIRAFDARHFMLAADVVEGSTLREAIPKMLRNPDVSYLHLHNAKPGCFAASVTRA